VPAPGADWRSRTDAHAPRASLHPSLRQPWQYAYDTDPIELACVACTLEYQDGRWVHDRSCPARQRRTA
jgi:hypothetical protein